MCVGKISALAGLLSLFVPKKALAVEKANHFNCLYGGAFLRLVPTKESIDSFAESRFDRMLNHAHHLLNQEYAAQAEGLTFVTRNFH